MFIIPFYRYRYPLPLTTNHPEGLGRFADLVVCRVTHAPSLTVSKTGVLSTKMAVSWVPGIALSPFVYRGLDAITNFF